MAQGPGADSCGDSVHESVGARRRVAQHGGGWLVDDYAEAEVWFETLRRALLTPNGEYAERRQAASRYTAESLETMAEQYLDAYRLALGPTAASGAVAGAPETRRA